MPRYHGALELALLQQLDETQWLPPEQLAQQQRRQLALLLKHAFETVPFYRERWGEPPDAARLDELPLLTRSDLNGRFHDLKSAAIPAEHGPVSETRTSGSTGAPVRVLKTLLAGLLWNVFTLRDHAWHGRDLAAKLAIIRTGAVPDREAGWGFATAGLLETGPNVAQGVEQDAAALLAWLESERPGYLLTYPTLVAELARLSLERGVRLPGLREVRTFAEQLDPELRALCREAWGAKLADIYSAAELGYVALQCPGHEHYHVQSEGVIVEILDDEGRSCATGQIGRVVVTVLHNFAMPLIRYDIGDFAEAGPACACGRGLPVLRRIHGRVRNMLVTADGRRYWPFLGGYQAIREAPQLRQAQFAQIAPDLIEARLVASGPLTAEQEEGMRRRVLARLPPGMRMRIGYRDRIARGAGGKFEEFVCELPARP